MDANVKFMIIMHHMAKYPINVFPNDIVNIFNVWTIATREIPNCDLILVQICTNSYIYGYDFSIAK